VFDIGIVIGYIDLNMLIIFHQHGRPGQQDILPYPDLLAFIIEDSEAILELANLTGPDLHL